MIVTTSNRWRSWVSVEAERTQSMRQSLIFLSRLPEKRTPPGGFEAPYTGQVFGLTRILPKIDSHLYCGVAGDRLTVVNKAIALVERNAMSCC